ncbi:hypothetical protein HK100_005214, partial [Physocladia obscura]
DPLIKKAIGSLPAAILLEADVGDRPTFPLTFIAQVLFSKLRRSYKILKFFINQNIEI